MKKNLVLGTLATFTLMLSACQSTPSSPVMARADATFETTGLGKTKLIAQQNALAAAKKQCGHKTPIVITDETKYNGILDEQTGRLVNKGASVLGAVIGSKLPNINDDTDYEYVISFKCQ